MSLNRLLKFVSSFVLIVCLLVLPWSTLPAGAQSQNTQPASASSDAQAQTPPSAPEPKPLPSPLKHDYSKGAGYFPNPLRMYMSAQVPAAVTQNAPRIGDLVRNGRIMLSMSDAIALGLTDNLDLAIARYTLPIADTDLLLTAAGGSPRGIASGLVAGTPGGTSVSASGSGAGGTVAGAGGAGAGASGIVQTASGAGPQPDSFDPILSGTLLFEHQTSPQSNTITTGTNVLQANQTIGNFTYFQGFFTGTAISVAYDNSRVASNNVRSLTNPTLNSSFRFSVRQHLLQGFPPSINRRFIVQARNTKKIAEASFKNQVIFTVSQIQLIYWDLVNAYEDVKVKERSLALAEKTLSDNKKQVEIGTLAPIEIVRAQSTVAQDQQDLLTSQTNLQLQQLNMKNAITRNLPNNSALMQADVVPTDTIIVPEQDNLPSVQDLIQIALASRFDYLQQKLNLKNGEISIKGARNGLLPSLDLTGFYGASSLAGIQNPLGTCPATNPPQGCTPPGTIPTTGFGDAFSNLFNSTAPDKGVQITLTVPLRNRAAQAVATRAQLEYRQNQLGLQQLENTIGITVRNDQFTVQQNRARVVAATEAQRLAAQTLDAEQKKYSLGSSTYFNVLSAQRDLAQAESNVVAAKTAYAKSLVQLDRDTAQTLERNHISIEDAVTGEVKTAPSVPGVAPNPSATETTTEKPKQ